MRKLSGEGKYCTLAKKGAPEAGAIFVIVNQLNGNFRLFGPAPGPSYDDKGDRRFISELPVPATESDVLALLARRKKFDTDLWVVEVEDRDGTAGLVETL